MALEIICISLIVIILILNIFLIIKNKKTNDNSDLIKNINLNFEKQNFPLLLHLFLFYYKIQNN